MDSISAEQLILEEGKSEALNQAFQLLADATDGDGQPRYGARVRRELARMIVCRTYSASFLELSHLILAAADCDAAGRYENLFWGVERATPGAFRMTFDGMTPRRFTSSGERGLIVKLGDRIFVLSYSRMPVLAAMLEFMVTTLGYQVLDETVAPLLSGHVTASGVGDVANALSRALYGYLKEHLPSVQVQKQNRSFMEFLSDRSGGDLDLDGLNDDAVLTYWLEAGQTDSPGGLEVRTFGRVFQTAARLTRVLRAALDRVGLSAAKSIGTDREAGEVDPGDVEGLLAAADETSDLLEPFRNHPLAAIKFINGREQDALADLSFDGNAGERFPLSVMRNAVFGKAQARITNGLRRKVGPAGMSALIEQVPEETYAGRLDVYEGLTRHLRRLKLACFAVMVEGQRPEALALAVDLAPDADLSGVRGVLRDEPQWGDATVVSFQAEEALRRFFSDAVQPGGALADLMIEARRALKGIARQGFRPEERSRPETMDGFSEAPRHLGPLERVLERFVRINAPARDWNRQFTQDAPVFANQFKRLYGEAHV